MGNINLGYNTNLIQMNDLHNGQYGFFNEIVPLINSSFIVNDPLVRGSFGWLEAT